MSTGELMSARQYALHRKEQGLNGTTHQAVLRAVKDGRLDGAAHQDERGRWRIDPAEADRLWFARTTATKQRGDRHRGGRPKREPAGAGPLFGDTEPPAAPADPPELEPAGGARISMRKAQEVRATYQAALTQLEYQERSGSLVRVAEVRSVQFTLARQVREAVLQVPDRVAAMLAAEGDELRVRNLLNDELTEALRQLAREVANGTV